MLLACYWHATGVLLARDTGGVLACYWRDIGPILAGYWNGTDAILAQYWPTRIAQFTLFSMWCFNGKSIKVLLDHYIALLASVTCLIS